MVLVEILSDPKWLPGIILECLGPLSYRVKVANVEWRCHIDQILANVPHTKPKDDNNTSDNI